MELVYKQSLVAVIGPSGSGKSSVVLAGLIPHLNNIGGWHILKFRPGKYPCKTLTDIVTSLEQYSTDKIDRQAIEIKYNRQCLKQTVEKFLLKNCSQRLLLVADQFEELYTLCQNEKERQKFLDELLICVRDAAKFTFLFTMRADFLP